MVNWALAPAQGRLKDVTPFNRYGVTLPDDPKRDVLLNAADVHRAIAAMTNERHRAFCEGAWHLASRPAELAVLRWEDVDPGSKLITFRESTKNGVARTVPFEADGAFGRWLITHEGGRRYLFASGAPGHDLTAFGLAVVRDVGRTWNRDARPLVGGQAVVRDLRRSRASHYDRCGIAWSDSEYLLGHSPKGSHARYRRADLTRLAGDLERLVWAAKRAEVR